MIFRIPLYIYPFDVVAAYDEDIPSIKEYLSKGIDPKEIEDAFELEITTKGKTMRFTNGVHFIYLAKNDDRYSLLNFISHEVFHLTTFFMDYIGNTFDVYVNGESYAYLQGYLTEQIVRNINA